MLYIHQSTGCKAHRTGPDRLSHGATLISTQTIPPAAFGNATNHCHLLRVMEEEQALLLEREEGHEIPLLVLSS